MFVFFFQFFWNKRTIAGVGVRRFLFSLCDVLNSLIAAFTALARYTRMISNWMLSGLITMAPAKYQPFLLIFSMNIFTLKH